MKTLKIAKIDNIFFSQSQQYTLEEGSQKKVWLTDWLAINTDATYVEITESELPKSNAEI